MSINWRHQPLRSAVLLLAIQCTLLPRLCQEVQVQHPGQSSRHIDEELVALSSGQFPIADGEARLDSSGSLLTGAQQAAQHFGSAADSAIVTASKENAAGQTADLPAEVLDVAALGIPLPVQPAPGLESCSLGCLSLHPSLRAGHLVTWWQTSQHERPVPAGSQEALSPNATALVIADLRGSALSIHSPDDAKALVPQLILPDVILPPATVLALSACMRWDS